MGCSNRTRIENIFLIFNISKFYTLKGYPLISQTEKLNNLGQEIIKITKQKQGTEMSNYKNVCIYLVSILNNSNYFILF
jgi:hypothetical protein